MRLKLFPLFILLSTFCRTQTADLRILQTINARNYPVWDRTMKSTSASVYFAVPVTLIGMGAEAYINKGQDKTRNMLKSAVTMALASTIATALKFSVQRPRPKTAYPGLITERDHAGTLSFPSGHTTTAFSTATALSLSYRKWYVTVPAYLYAGLVAYSRMRLGMHYPTDVLGGIAIGAGSGLLVWKLDEIYRKKKTRAPLTE